jgi:anaerobic selenocysteine-containing dehydrogenase
MKFTRREFLKLGIGAAAAGAAGYFGQWGLREIGTPNSLDAAEAGVEAFVPAICSLCPSGCGLTVRVVDGRAVKVEGNALHPVNQGVCCPKGQASLEVLYSPERLPGPMRRKKSHGDAASTLGDWERISWDDAIRLVTQKLQDLRAAGQSHTLALLYGETEGQTRPLLQRFMAAYGSPNLIAREAMDTQAARLAMLLTQGVNGFPVYDLENCRYLMSFGGSPLETGRNVMRSIAGISYMRRGQPDRGKVVVVDSRLNVTAGKADEWVPIRPGTLGAFALGIAHVLIQAGFYDREFVENFVFGFEDFVDEQGRSHRGFKSLVMDEYTLDRVEAITGVPGGTIARLAGEFGTNKPAVAMMPTGRMALTSGNGLFTAMAIHALNALAGSIETPGGVQVQNYPAIADWPALPADPVAEKGRAMARVDGAGSGDYPLALSVYQALGEHILSGQPYPINAMMLYRSNPVFDTPQGGRFADALARVPFVVSFSPVLDESAAYADLILPESTFFETWQDALIEGTGYPGVALAQPVVHPVQDTRNTGDVLLQITQGLGGPVAQALPWAGMETLLRYRYSKLDMGWDDLKSKGVWSGLVYYFAGRGSRAWNDAVGRDRLAAPKDGRFDLFSRELFAALDAPDDRTCLPHFEEPVESAPATEYPFLLISQETMTQPRNWSGIVPSLQEAYGVQTGTRWESWVEINPQAAGALGIKDGDPVWVESPAGKVKARARVYPGIWPNAVHLPLGQGHLTLAQWDRSSNNLPRQIGVNPYSIVASGTEKISGLAVSMPTRVKVYRA